MRVEEIAPDGQVLVGRSDGELVLYWPEGRKHVEMSRKLFETCVRQSEQNAAYSVALEMIAQRRFGARKFARRVLDGTS